MVFVPQAVSMFQFIKDKARSHLRTVTVTVPIANYDNNQHAENENLRLQNLWDGIETMAAVMSLRL